MDEKKHFEKQANTWLEESRLSCEEDDTNILYLKGVIDNLKSQIAVKKKSSELRKQRAREYIKTVLKNGYEIHEKYRSWLKAKSK